MSLTPSHALVIPCFNEAKRLKVAEYRAFIEAHPDVIVCFVNDGSRDNTLEILHGIQRDYPAQVIVAENARNMGIGETVRNGVLTTAGISAIREVGFLDADLSTGFDEYLEMLQIMRDSSLLMIFGSRKSEDGRNISYSPIRLLAATITRIIIRRIVKLPITDTQCGAKIFAQEAIPVCFGQPFVSRWLFDVEVILRLTREKKSLDDSKYIREFFLLRWKHEPDSKVTLKDTIHIPYQFLKIIMHYRINLFS